MNRKLKLGVLAGAVALALGAAYPAAADTPLAVEEPVGGAGEADDDGGFPWGILGLAGLAGLAGLRRREEDVRDPVRGPDARTTTTTTTTDDR